MEIRIVSSGLNIEWSGEQEAGVGIDCAGLIVDWS